MSAGLKKIISGLAIAIALSAILTIGSWFIIPLFVLEIFKAVGGLFSFTMKDNQWFGLMFILVWLLSVLYHEEAITYVRSYSIGSNDQDEE